MQSEKTQLRSFRVRRDGLALSKVFRQERKHKCGTMIAYSSFTPNTHLPSCFLYSTLDSLTRSSPLQKHLVALPRFRTGQTPATSQTRYPAANNNNKKCLLPQNFMLLMSLRFTGNPRCTLWLLLTVAVLSSSHPVFFGFETLLLLLDSYICGLYKRSHVYASYMLPFLHIFPPHEFGLTAALVYVWSVSISCQPSSVRNQC